MWFFDYIREITGSPLDDRSYKTMWDIWKKRGADPDYEPTRIRHNIDNRGVFRPGLAYFVFKEMKAKLGKNATVVDWRFEGRKPMPKGFMPSESDVERALAMLPFKPRDYQEEAFRAMVRRTNGVAEIGTGGGKTAIIAMLIAAWNKKTLIPVRSKDLAKQLRAEIADYLGMDISEIGIWYGGRDKCFGRITVGVVNSLVKAVGLKYIRSVEVMITDECHNGMSNTYGIIQDEAVNCCVRYGFSATPYPREFKVEGRWVRDDWPLYERFGPVVYTKNVADLIQDGYLSRPTAFIINNVIERPDEEEGEEHQYDEYAREYEEYIANNAARNQMIVDLILKGRSLGERQIIFIRSIEHGHNLVNALLEAGVGNDELGFVDGQDTLSRRDNVFAGFQAEEISIMIGSEKILSEGLNFIIDSGIIASAGRSSNGVIQKAGRLLRLPKEDGKDVDRTKERKVKLFDFSDLGHGYFESQAYRRKREIKDKNFVVEVMEFEDIMEGYSELI